MVDAIYLTRMLLASNSKSAASAVTSQDKYQYLRMPIEFQSF